MTPDANTSEWNALIPTALRARTQGLNVAARETLFRIGDPVRHVYLVLQGEARLVRFDRQGGEVILQRSRGGVATAVTQNLGRRVGAQP